MKERPILFSGPMVRAILEGRKSQTRRAVPDRLLEKYSDYDDYCSQVMPTSVACKRDYEAEFFSAHCKYGVPGDRLWVRETFNRTNPGGQNGIYYYKADDSFPTCLGGGQYIGDEVWKPSIHMPRAASRILLEITDIRVQRLNDISGDDAKAEGFKGNIWNDITARKCEKDYWAINWFRALWVSINGQLSWHKNPWVWCISFKVVEGCNL